MPGEVTSFSDIEFRLDLLSEQAGTDVQVISTGITVRATPDVTCCHIYQASMYMFTHFEVILICFCRNRFVSFLFVSFIESESWWPGCFHSFPTSQVDACLSEIHLLGARSSPANPKSVRSTICSTVRSATSLRLSSYRFRGWAAGLSNACQPSPGATIKLCRRCQPGKAWQTLHA